MGLLGRLALHAELLQWLLLFVDDIWSVLEEGDYESAATALAFLAALGTPFSWGKLRLGVRLVWIGYSIDAWLCSAVAGEAKLHIVIEFLTAVAAGKRLTWDAIASGASRTRWAIAAQPCLAAYMPPLHAWAAALEKAHVKAPAKPGKLLMAVAAFLLGAL